MTLPGTSIASRYDLTRFSLPDMTRCGSELRRLGADAASMEGVADGVARYLYERLGTASRDRSACALVRVFVTLPFESLEPALQQFAESSA